MRRRATEGALLLAMAACGAGPSGAEHAPVASVASVATPAVTSGWKRAGVSGGRDRSAGERGDSSLRLPLRRHPRATLFLRRGGRRSRSRRAVARRGTRSSRPATDAFERGDLVGAERIYASARVAGAKRRSGAVGLARVRIARCRACRSTMGSVEGECSSIAAGGDGSWPEQPKTSPSFGPCLRRARGRARLLLGDADGAIDARAPSRGARAPVARARSPLAARDRAARYRPRRPDAVTELARALELDPRSAARHGNLGTALMMVGRTRGSSSASTMLRACVWTTETRVLTRISGPRFLGPTSEPDAIALGELERAVALDPQRASYRSNLGFALQQAGPASTARWPSIDRPSLSTRHSPAA